MKIALEACRVNAGYSIEEVSDKTGIPLELLASWEQDVECLKEAETEDVLKLCRLYGIKAEDIKL